MARGTVIRLLDADPDLAAGIEGDDLEEARRLVVAERYGLWPGPWDPDALRNDDDPRFAVVVLGGLVIRERSLAEGVHAEIFGPGDVLDPWSGTEAFVPTQVRWTVIAPGEVAALDRRFLAAVRRWPILALRLFERAAEQQERLSVRGSINAVPHVEQRILAMLWHLAGLYGKVRPGGAVILPLQLTHAGMGRLVRARRPTVTRAMTKLTGEGLVELVPGGGVILPAASRTALAELAAEPLGGTPGIVTIEPIERAPAPAGSSPRALDRLRAQVSKLRAAEADYRGLFELAGIGVALMDASTAVLLRINARLAKLLGMPAADALGTSLLDRIHAADLADVRRQLDRLRHREVAQASFQCRVVRPDGSVSWTRNSVAMLDQDPTGRDRLMVVVEDITEQQEAAAARDALERQLRDELAAMRRLHELTRRTAEATDVSSMLDEVLAATMTLQDAVLGTVQLFDGDEQALVLAAHRGFSDPFAAHYHLVEPLERAVCAGALETREPLTVEDITTDPAYVQHRQWIAAAGVRSIACAPMVGADGAVLGVVSTYFATARRLSERERRSTDLYLRLVVELLERAQAEEAAEADAVDMQLLRDLSARLVGEHDLPLLLREILAAAVVLARADAGTVQLVDAPAQELVLLATHGFDQATTHRFRRVDASSTTTCGRALASRSRVLLDHDDADGELVDPSCRLHLQAGYVSAQSTPLVTRAGSAIGMLSTHWRTHHRPAERELRYLDLLARQAADLIALAMTDHFEDGIGDPVHRTALHERTARQRERSAQLRARSRELLDRTSELSVVFTRSAQGDDDPTDADVG